VRGNDSCHLTKDIPKCSRSNREDDIGVLHQLVQCFVLTDPTNVNCIETVVVVS
jgi:hypothetical protein